jgi:predicted Zn-dependent protease
MDAAKRDAHMEDGHMALATGELEEAVRCYRGAVDEDPASFEGWHALAMALIKTGRIPEAIEAAGKATQADPNEQMGWTCLSMAYVRNNQIAEAEAAGAKAKVISWGGKVKAD